MCRTARSASAAKHREEEERKLFYRQSDGNFVVVVQSTGENKTKVRNSVHRIGTIRSVSGGFAFYGNLAALIVFGGTGRSSDVRIGALHSRNSQRFIFYALRNPFRPRNSEKSAERRGKRATKMERKGKNEIQRMDEFVPIKMPRSRATPEVSASPGEHHSPFLLIKLHRDSTKVSIKGLLLLLKSNFFLHNFVAFASLSV